MSSDCHQIAYFGFAAIEKALRHHGAGPNILHVKKA
jgi:hypothetical protein